MNENKCENLEVLGYVSPFIDREAEAVKELDRLTDLIQSVEIPTNPQSKKDYQAKVQAKMLYNEINSDLRRAINVHNSIISDKNEHKEAFLKEADHVFRCVNTTPEVNYGAKYGTVGLDREQYIELLFDTNEGHIKEAFEILSSELNEDVQGADMAIKRTFDNHRQAVLSFMEKYSITKENILAFVEITLAAIAKEEIERKQSITDALKKNLPDQQTMSRIYTGYEESTIGEDGFRDYGVATAGN